MVRDSILTEEEKINKIQKIKGFSRTTAESFVENIPNFLEFLRQCDIESKISSNVDIPQLSVDTNNPLYGKSIIMTGFRDKMLEEKIKLLGATISGSVSKNTFVVLTKDKDDKTGKIQKARELGLKIMTPDEFTKEYDI